MLQLLLLLLLIITADVATAASAAATTAIATATSATATAAAAAIRDVKQITKAGATTAAVTEKAWGEYVLLVCQILAKRNTKMSET